MRHAGEDPLTTLRSRLTPRLCSKVMWKSASYAQRARSAITRALLARRRASTISAKRVLSARLHRNTLHGNSRKGRVGDEGYR